jgi:hypothetical protein
MTSGLRHPVALPEELARLGPLEEVKLLPGGRVLVGWPSARGIPLQIVSRDGTSAVASIVTEDVMPSADGKRMVFYRGDYVYVADIDGGAVERLFAIPKDPAFIGVSTSPDGSRLLLISMKEIAVYDIPSRTQQTVVTVGDGGALSYMASGSAAWTGPDRFAYFVFSSSGSPRTTELREVVLGPDGSPTGASRVLWTGPLAVRMLLTHGGTRFGFMHADVQSDVYVARASPGYDRLEQPPRRLTTSGEDDNVVGWGLGDRLAMNSMRDGQLRPFAQPLDGGAPEPLAPQMDGGVTVAGALADGYLLRVSGQNGSELVRRARDESMTSLASLGAEDFVCSPCVGGARPRCVVVARGGADDEFYLVDLRTGARTLFFNTPATSTSSTSRTCTLSADGNVLTFCDPPGFRVVPVGTTRMSAKLVVPSPPFEEAQRSVVLPNGLGYLVTGVGFDGHQFALAHVDRTGRARALWTSDTSHMARPRIAANGRDIAFDMTQFDLDISVLEPAGAPP